MRLCRCGRPLEDPEYHEITTVIESAPPIVGWYQGNPVRGEEPDGNGRRIYECRMRLIAESPITGKRLVPDSPQRVIQLDILAARNARFVHPELLEEAA